MNKFYEKPGFEFIAFETEVIASDTDIGDIVSGTPGVDDGDDWGDD